MRRYRGVCMVEGPDIRGASSHIEGAAMTTSWLLRDKRAVVFGAGVKVPV